MDMKFNNESVTVGIIMTIYLTIIGFVVWVSLKFIAWYHLDVLHSGVL